MTPNQMGAVAAAEPGAGSSPDCQSGEVDDPALDRKEFEALLNQALASPQEPGFALGVLMVQVNGIGRINRALGYDAGEEVLESLGNHLRQNLGPSAVLTRFAEGCFVALLEGISGEAEGVRMANEAVEVTRSPCFTGSLQVRLTASVGVALAGAEGERAGELLRNVDAATQDSKLRGPNHVEVFRPAARQRIVRQLQLEAELCAALERDELELHFQPIVSLRDSELMAIEALLRWQHPDRGLIPPNSSYPLPRRAG